MSVFFWGVLLSFVPPFGGIIGSSNWFSLDVFFLNFLRETTYYLWQFPWLFWDVLDDFQWIIETAAGDQKRTLKQK